VISRLKNKVALSFVRHTLTGAGGFLVSEGLTTGRDVDAAVGATMTLVGFVASILKARREKRDADVTAAMARRFDVSGHSMDGP
jgi:hypothetical protein